MKLKISDENLLLRFSTAGSVDDGKSTLIGRLLFDAKSIMEDRLKAIEKSSVRRGREGMDLALLTDGLAAEREQGITIDVAYRYFATPQRKFIIADTPGHEQYTRNMVTGASTADLALILIDASKGIQPQSRRHAYISALLGIKHIVVCVNKMDLVEWDQAQFNEIKNEFTEFVKDMNIPDIRFVPISALQGDNVVEASDHMPWYKGPSILNILETVEVIENEKLEELRFPVQYVNRPHANFRGYCGTIAGGVAKPGQDVVILPSRKKTKIKSIVTFDGDLQEAFPPEAVTLTLEDEIDVSRGDLIVAAENVPSLTKDIFAYLCWMSEEGLNPNQKYIIKQACYMNKAKIIGVDHVIDMDSLSEKTTKDLKLNDIGLVRLKVGQELPVDAYTSNKTTGSFILIDASNYNTVAAGMISLG